MHAANPLGAAAQTEQEHSRNGHSLVPGPAVRSDNPAQGVTFGVLNETLSVVQLRCDEEMAPAFPIASADR